MVELIPIHGLRYVVPPAPPAGDTARPIIGAGPIAEQVGDTRLRDLARAGMRVVIAFTDATRHSPDQMLIEHILRGLAACGVGDEAVTLLCATGLHRPMTPAERVAKLGAEFAARLTTVDHDAMDAGGLVSLGDVHGLPVVVNRLCTECDLLIAIGVVEPHQYAGYSGGAKTVVIGCGGEATIAATHGPAMLDRDGVLLGRIVGNPFQEFVRAAGDRIGLRYVANALLDAEGNTVAIAEGAPRDVQDALIERGRPLQTMTVDAPVRLAVLGVSPAKAANLYQASRAITYVALADRTPVPPGAPIVLVAAIPEGAGQGTGEQRFRDALGAATSPADLLLRMRRDGFPAGAQRAYILAQALARNPVIVVAPGHEALVRACHMEYAPDLASALGRAITIARERFGDGVGDLDCLLIQNALATLPRLDAGALGNA
jgi:nickel-dependent lactate racemase